MSDQELRDQFQRCQRWQDAEQWKELALQYYARGYVLNARHCFEMADQVRASRAVTMETVPA